MGFTGLAAGIPVGQGFEATWGSALDRVTQGERAGAVRNGCSATRRAS